MKYFKLWCFILALSICSCIQIKDVNKARGKAEDLIVKIALGNALDEFPEKYFNSSQGLLILDDLRNKCDFANRKGNFINDFYQNEHGCERVSFIYEYYLQCDSIRFIITYNLGKEIELYEFKLEPIEKENDMITN